MIETVVAQNSVHARPAVKDTVLGDVIDIALQVAEERGQLMEEMKAALITQNNDQVLVLARQLCGLR